MILPIIAYGDPVLRKLGKSIDKEYPALESLLENMFETMYGAKGIGLAAPQIGLPIRIFIVDATPFKDDEELELEERNFLSTFKQVFINAQIIDETGDEWVLLWTEEETTAKDGTKSGIEAQESFRIIDGKIGVVNQFQKPLPK